MAVSEYDEKTEAAEASETQNPEVADERKEDKDTEEMQHEKGEDGEDALQEPGSLDAKTLSLAICAGLEGGHCKVILPHISTHTQWGIYIYIFRCQQRRYQSFHLMCSLAHFM